MLADREQPAAVSLNISHGGAEAPPVLADRCRL